MRKGNEETRTRILEVSEEILSEKGFSNLIIDDITKRTGISHGTFYIYFKNKKALLLELVEETFEILYKATEEPWKKGHTYMSLLESITGYLVMYKKHWKVIRAWREATYTDEDFTKMWDLMFGKITSRIQKNIEWSISKNIFRSVNAPIAAGALAGMIEHYVNIMIKGEDFDITQVAETIADLWYHSLIIK